MTGDGALSPKAKARQLGIVVGFIRKNFWLLKKVSDSAIADLGLTASMRAILEYIHLNGAHSVPQIAAAKHVARQSIQELVDALMESELVEAIPNPLHKRSPLIGMTNKGEQMFAIVRSRDDALLTAAASTISMPDLDATNRALQALFDHLESSVQPGEAAN